MFRPHFLSSRRRVPMLFRRQLARTGIWANVAMDASMCWSIVRWGLGIWANFILATINFLIYTWHLQPFGLMMPQCVCQW